MQNKDIRQEINRLSSKLTGMLDKDIQTNKEIYRLQKMLITEIENKKDPDR